MAEPTTPTGAQCLMDGASPRTFTAKAMSILSGGEFVAVSGVAADYNGVTNDLSTGYAWDDIQVTAVASGTATYGQAFNGINLRNVGSGEKATVATRGVYLAMCGGSVLPGYKVQCTGNHVETLTSGPVPSALHALSDGGAKCIGRALTMGYSGTSPGSTYVLFDLQA